MKLTIPLLGASWLCCVPVASQEVDPGSPPVVEGFVPQKLQWPRDRERTVCVVAGEDHSLGRMVDHIARRHYPALPSLLELPGASYFATPLPARWVRQYADAVILEREAEARGITGDAADEVLSGALKAGFEDWLAEHVAERRKRGITAELTQNGVNQLLDKYQLEFGLETEVAGWLDALVPAVDPEDHGPLLRYFETHAREFGGRVDLAHVLVETRDRVTGELLTGAARDAAMQRLAEVRRRLAAEPARFADIARELSDDRFTRAQGGALRGVTRFDPRLPAAVCRAAWLAADDEIVPDVETQFGVHFVRRLDHHQLYYIATPLEITEQIAVAIRREAQERLLFGLRERLGVVLRY